jgi:hypothetical protein
MYFEISLFDYRGASPQLLQGFCLAEMQQTTGFIEDSTSARILLGGNATDNWFY